MPVTPTYPGVYIEEVPSGVRTITGVATAITAFIGRAPRGPVNDPTRVQNFGDYTRAFGGLSLDSTMSFAVQQFFNNGGTDAIIVRVYEPSAGGTGIGSVVLAADVRARGTLTLAAQPTVGDTMTIGSTVYTFRATAPSWRRPRLRRRPAGPYGGQRRDRGDASETQSTIIRAINRLGTTGFRASTTAEQNVVAADRWVQHARHHGRRGRHGRQCDRDALDVRQLVEQVRRHHARLDVRRARPRPRRGGPRHAEHHRPAGPGRLTIKGRIYTFDANGALDDTTADHIEIGSGSGRPARTSSTRSTPRHRYRLLDADDAKRRRHGRPWRPRCGDRPDRPNARRRRQRDHDRGDDGGGQRLRRATLGTTRAGRDARRSVSDDRRQEPRGLVEQPAADVNHASPIRATWTRSTCSSRRSIRACRPARRRSAPSVSSTSRSIRSHHSGSIRCWSRDRAWSDVATTSRERPGIGNVDVALHGGNDGQLIDDNTISEANLEEKQAGPVGPPERRPLQHPVHPAAGARHRLGPSPGTPRSSTARTAGRSSSSIRRAAGSASPQAEAGVDALNLRDENAAVYFPRVNIANPLRDNQLSEFAPCGVVAGLYARTDALARRLEGARRDRRDDGRRVRTLTVPLTDGENGRLNPLGSTASARSR